MIAALFVQTNGAYFGLPDVDPWDIRRDARLYAGPHAVVCHPPCQRWGRYWFGGPSARVRRQRGDDEGCFASAVASVRKWSGVLEHPAGSSAWDAFGINHPPMEGGWIAADLLGGWTCAVEQGHYGHSCRKPTWLYAVGTLPPALTWGASIGTVVGTTKRTGQVAMLSRKQRDATPAGFRDLLLSIARTARQLETVNA